MTEKTPTVERVPPEEVPAAEPVDKAGELLTKLRYLQAEFENYRKRVERDAQTIVKFAHEDLLARLLPVLDEMDAAVDALTGEAGQGVRMVRDNLAKALREAGLQERRDSGRGTGKAPSGAESGEDRHPNQTEDGDGLQGPNRRQGLLAPGDLRDDPPEDQDGRRGVPRPDDFPGRHHGTGVLQRQPKAGHEGRGQDRGPRGPPPRERADRGRPGLRLGQEGRREDRGPRPRRGTFDVTLM